MSFQQGTRRRGHASILALWSVAIFASGAATCRNRPSLSQRVLAAVELDHVYLYAPARSAEADVVAALIRAGLRVGRRNEFPDGVVGRYVRFDNVYLEVLWHDGTTPTDADTRRRARWETTGASPIGLGLRRLKRTPEALPFPTRGFAAPWLQPGTELRLLGTEADTQPPSLFVVPDDRAHTGTVNLERQLTLAPSEDLRRRLSSRVHPLGVRSVTGIRVVVRPAGISDAARMLSDAGFLQIVGGNEPLLELYFDHAPRHESRDLRPLLPLVLHY